MHAYASLAVYEHIQTLLEEAAERRDRATGRPSLRDRIASVASSIRTAIDSAADGAPRLVPDLKDYPYRS